MFSQCNAIFAILALVFVSQAIASPSPGHLRRALSVPTRELLDTIPVHIKRAGESDNRKRGLNTIPAEVATKSPQGTIEVYKRDNPYNKRAVNTIPVEVATKSPQGTVEIY